MVNSESRTSGGLLLLSRLWSPILCRHHFRFFGRLKIDRQTPRPRASHAFADGSAAPTFALMLGTHARIVKVPIVDAFGVMRFHCVRDRQPVTQRGAESLKIAKSRQEGFHKADMRLAGRTPKRDGFARFRSQDRASSEIASHDDVKQLWQPQTALCGTGKDPTESQIMLKGGR